MISNANFASGASKTTVSVSHLLSYCCWKQSCNLIIIEGALITHLHIFIFSHFHIFIFSQASLFWRRALTRRCSLNWRYLDFTLNIIYIYVQYLDFTLNVQYLNFTLSVIFIYVQYLDLTLNIINMQNVLTLHWIL